MSVLDKLREQARTVLEPEETLQAVFGAQTGQPRPVPSPARHLGDPHGRHLPVAAVPRRLTLSQASACVMVPVRPSSQIERMA